jgi:hypothetical protein
MNHDDQRRLMTVLVALGLAALIIIAIVVFTGFAG